MGVFFQFALIAAGQGQAVIEDAARARTVPEAVTVAEADWLTPTLSAPLSTVGSSVSMSPSAALATASHRGPASSRPGAINRISR